MTDPFISRIRPDQIPNAARVLASAFAHAPRYKFLIPDDDRRQEKLPWLWEATIRASIHSGGLVHVALDAHESNVLAVALWSPPLFRKQGLATVLKSGMWAEPIELGVAAWSRRMSLGPRLDALKPPDPCWRLKSIGVDPSAQRTGMGSALINHMLPCIDRDALPTFLDTSQPNNLGYYERFGFRVTAESTLPNGVPLWGMTRPPHSQATE